MVQDMTEKGCFVTLVMCCLGLVFCAKHVTCDTAGSSSSYESPDSIANLLTTVETLTTTVADLTARIDTLVAGVEELEKQAKLFKHVITKQQADLEEYEFSTEKMRSQIESQMSFGDQLTNLYESVKYLEKLAVARYKDSRTVGHCNTQKLLDLVKHTPKESGQDVSGAKFAESATETMLDATQEEMMATLKEKVKLDDLKRQQELAQEEFDPVAFHARMAKTSLTGIGKDYTILFDQVKLNLGNHFDVKTGMFKAHKSGMYVFSLTVMSYPDERIQEIDVAIVKENDILATAFAHGDGKHNDQGSVTVATTLKVGERVWVRNLNIDGSALWGHGFTSFMGALVVPF